MLLQASRGVVIANLQLYHVISHKQCKASTKLTNVNTKLYAVYRIVLFPNDIE